MSEQTDNKPKVEEKTAVQKVVEFCEKEGIIWSGVVVPEEQTSTGGLILRAKVIVEYKKNTNSPNP